MSKKILLKTENDTIKLAEKIAADLAGNEVIALYGELGTGKTFFSQALCKFLGVTEYVSSPSYVIMNEYEGFFHINHLDLYRLKSPEEVLELGLEEVMENGVTIIEWPESAEIMLPKRVLKIRFDFDNNQRTATII